MPALNRDIARRYLFGKKSTNSINIITGISIFGISIGTAALVLILSVFNGFEGLLSGLFNAFNPDLKVIPIEGKYFTVEDNQLLEIEAIPGIVAVAKTVEEIALFEYKGIQELGKIKGIDNKFLSIINLDSLFLRGHYRKTRDKVQYAYMGSSLKNKLGININDKLSPLTVYMPSKRRKMLGAKEFNSKTVYPAGIFSVKGDSDYEYVLSSYEVVEQLLESPGQISALEIKLTEKANEDKTKTALTQILGEGYRIKNRFQQDESFLKVMQIEKWISFLITGLTMLLIAFNLLGALWMIVLDKKKDIAVLKALGFNSHDVRSLFINLGLFITAIGVVLGFVVALILYFLQKNYGLIGVPEGFMMDSYPIQLRVTDFLIVTLVVVAIGWLTSLIPAKKAANGLGTLRIN